MDQEDAQRGGGLCFPYGDWKKENNNNNNKKSKESYR